MDNNNNESSGSFATTSSDINRSFQFMNLTFLQNSDSSVQAEAPTSTSLHPELLKQSASKALAHDYHMNKPVPNKILPSNLNPTIEEPKVSEEQIYQEKTLSEIGFKANEIEGWENINQPPKQYLYDLLKNMIDNYIKPNVQVRIGEVSFNCHMMVLQCYSDFFMDCSNEAIVQLPPEKITSQAFMMVYDWMLSAEPLVQREGILELFNAANFLKIKGLVAQCWVCLDDDLRFQEDTAFLLYLEARNYGLGTVQQLMLTRICKFFLTLVASMEFLLMSADEICTLLSSNSIGVNSEVEILMSAIRWLSYNWEERQCHMLEILNCVRFGLIPPWILVALGRDTDCIGVERVVENPSVKKMIEDGLSYTTTQLYYSDNVDNFLSFLERYQLTKPVQRQWICDPQSNFHHKIKCPNSQYITYAQFLEYLDLIRSRGKDHWKTLKMESQEEGLNFQCCLPKENAPKDQCYYYVIPKESRDQCVQFSGEMSDSEGTANNTTTSQTVDIKTACYQEIYSANNRTNARGIFDLRTVAMPIGQNNNNNNNNTREYTEYTKNIPLSQQSFSCCEVNQKAINIKKSILAKSYYCSMSSQDFRFTMANSALEHHHQYKIDDAPRTSSVQVRLLETSNDESLTSKDADTKQIDDSIFRQITQQKIFIFGGIDPYAEQHRANDSHGLHVLYYDGCDDSWRHLSNMPGSRHHHSAALFRGKIYIVGGIRPAIAGLVKPVFETSVWSFDPKRLEWHFECDLPQPRRDFGLIAYDNDIGDADGQSDRRRRHYKVAGLYIIGGESIDGTPLSSTLYYNVESKLWNEKAPLNIGRYGLVAAVVNDKNTSEIWIAGGVCGQKKGGIPVITDTMEYYNLSNDDGSWKQALKRLRIPRLFARFCTTGGGKLLYIIGGIGLDTQYPGEFLSLSSVDRYDFQEEQWNHLTDMNISRHGHDVVVVNDKILIFGGVSTDEKKTLKSVECFSTRTSKCAFETAYLPLALSGLAAVVVECDT